MEIDRVIRSTSGQMAIKSKEGVWGLESVSHHPEMEKKKIDLSSFLFLVCVHFSL